MPRLLPLLLLLAALGCWGGPRVELRITNASNEPAREVELDYGRAWGIAELPPGDSRQRVVRFTGPAATELRFLDAAARRHTSSGPRIEARSSGRLEARILADGRVEWVNGLEPPR